MSSSVPATPSRTSSRAQNPLSTVARESARIAAAEEAQNHLGKRICDVLPEYQRTETFQEHYSQSLTKKKTSDVYDHFEAPTLSATLRKGSKTEYEVTHTFVCKTFPTKCSVRRHWHETSTGKLNNAVKTCAKRQPSSEQQGNPFLVAKKAGSKVG
jgi:hypothetical protein